MFKLADKVKVKQILNTSKAAHLSEYIGQIGYIISYITEGNIKRYKVIFDIDKNITAYFRAEELERVV